MIKSFMITVIFYLYVLISNGVNTFVPSPRAEQAAILVNNKIYFYGGISGVSNTSYSIFSDFFYLDVSSSFIINDMPWYNLTPTTGLPPRTASTACTYGEDKNKIIFIGGNNIASSNSNFTTVYDITTQKWSALKTSLSSTDSIDARLLMQCVVLDNDIYVYGGSRSDIIELNTLNLNWTEFSPGSVTPSGVQGYSATLLNNKSILYIGGQPGGDVQTLSYTFDQLSMYNINNNTWSFIATSGNIPPSRYDHGGVYIPQYNQTLILYGFPNSSNPIMALDTVKFEWSIPTIKNAGGPTIGLRRFTSILIGAYIFIAFGAFNTVGFNSTNNFFLLDVSQKNNYEWVTSYDPTKQFQVPTTSTTLMPSTTSNSSQYNNDTLSTYNVGAIIGIVFGAIAGIIILSTTVVLIIRRYGYPLYYAPKEGSSDKQNNELRKNLIISNYAIICQ